MTMSSKRTAQIGLLAALTMLALCVTALVRGSHDLTPPPLAVGERVPAFSLQDAFGHNTVFPGDESQYLVLVFTPSASLNHLQRAAMEELTDSLRSPSPVPCRFVVVADQVTPDQRPRDLFSQAEKLLMDDHRTIACLMGADESQPLVCLIDPDGVLRQRTILSDNGVALEAQAQRGLQRMRDLVNESLLTLVKPVATNLRK